MMLPPPCVDSVLSLTSTGIVPNVLLCANLGIFVLIRPAYLFPHSLYVSTCFSTNSKQPVRSSLKFNLDHCLDQGCPVNSFSHQICGPFQIFQSYPWYIYCFFNSCPAYWITDILWLASTGQSWLCSYHS